ncbi:MAG: hypothetical protein Q4B17_05390 [Lautropia sp.]|nr:hypothetical protein [Lautropia sp.]
MHAQQTGTIAWPPRQRLHAGEFEATFDQGDLAHVSLRGHELVRLIYVAVRDPSWNTIPARPMSVQLHADTTHFSVRIRARTTDPHLDLDWHLDVTGFADGNLHLNFQAQAHQDCAFARIGLCLHVDAERFKQAEWVTESDTGTRTGSFPSRIHPQYLVDGIHHPCIAAFSSMRISLAPDTGLDIQLKGDQFEIEDQRNWTDATFKAYTTPLALGELHHLAAGATIQQTLHLSLRAPAQRPAARQGIIRATALAPLARPLPELGAALTGPEDLSGSPLPIPFAHCRIDIRSEADFHAITRGMKESTRGANRLELVLHPDAMPDQRFEKLLATTADVLALKRLILLGPPESLPSPDRVLAMKATTQSLLGNIPVGAGAPEAYADVARTRNDFGRVDFIAFPISPQHHVFDTQSIFETLPIQAQVARDAGQRTGSGQVIISPLTFGVRPNAFPDDSALPARDERLQRIGTAWLGASIGHLALGGATSVCLAPDLWQSDGKLPLAFTRLLQTLSSLRHAMLRPFQIDSPHQAFIFGATQGLETTIFLVNLSAREQMIQLSGLGEGYFTDCQASASEGPAPLNISPWPGSDSLISLLPYQVRMLRHRPAQNDSHHPDK